MLELIVNGAKEAVREIENANKQTLFAASVAINETAKQVQGETVSKFLPEKFTLRSKGQPWQKPGGKLGFNVKRSNKQNLEGTIGSQADWLESQEISGKKKKSSALAIPTLFWKEREQMMTKEKKPKQILSDIANTARKMGNEMAKYARQADALRSIEKQRERETGKHVWKNNSLRAARIQNEQSAAVYRRERAKLLRSAKMKLSALKSLAFTPFIQKVKGSRGIWVRTGNERFPIRKLFSFRREVTIPNKLGWIPWGIDRVEKEFPKNFEAAFEKAMKTAK